MSRNTQLHALGRIARLKADIELRQFSELRRHMAGLDHQIETLRAEMVQIADSAVRAWGDDATLDTQRTKDGSIPQHSAPSATHTQHDADAILGGPLAMKNGGNGAPSPDGQHSADMAPEALQTCVANPTSLDGDAIIQATKAGHRHLRDSRLANALTHALMLEHQAIEDERLRLMPSFEVARAHATRAFGRAEAIGGIARQLAAGRRTQIDRRSGADRAHKPLRQNGRARLPRALRRPTS